MTKAKPKTRYDKMSLEELQEAARDLNWKRASIVAEHKEVAAMVETKLAEQSAKEKFDAMSPAEKAALEKRIGLND